MRTPEDLWWKLSVFVLFSKKQIKNGLSRYQSERSLLSFLIITQKFALACSFLQKKDVQVFWLFLLLFMDALQIENNVLVMFCFLPHRTVHFI